MNKIVTKYIVKEFFFFMIAALIGITVLFIAVDFLALIFRKDIPVEFVSELYLYKIPETAYKLLPVATLFGAMVTIGIMSRNGELFALYGSGYSTTRIVGIFFITTTTLSLLSFFLSDYIVTAANKKKLYVQSVKIDQNPHYSMMRHNKIWYRSHNLIYYIQSFDTETNEIQNISLYEFNSDFSLGRHIIAASALFQNDHWLIKKGKMITFVSRKDFPQTENFETMKLYLPETPKDFKNIEKSTETLRLSELFKYVMKNKRSGIRNIIAELQLQTRISGIFTPIILLLIGIPFSIKTRKGWNLSKDVTFGFIMSITYWIVMSVSLSFGKSGTLHPFLAAWTSNILFLLLGSVLIYREFKTN